jgi:hypothetical protein
LYLLLNVSMFPMKFRPPTMAIKASLPIWQSIDGDRVKSLMMPNSTLAC